MRDVDAALRPLKTDEVTQLTKERDKYQAQVEILVDIIKQDRQIPLLTPPNPLFSTTKDGLPKKFRIALAAAGISQSAFARRCRVSPQSLNQTLQGRSSKRLLGKIRNFTEKQFKELF